jgi:hypothetical protein
MHWCLVYTDTQSCSASHAKPKPWCTRPCARGGRHNHLAATRRKDIGLLFARRGPELGAEAESSFSTAVGSGRRCLCVCAGLDLELEGGELWGGVHQLWALDALTHTSMTSCACGARKGRIRGFCFCVARPAAELFPPPRTSCRSPAAGACKPCARGAWGGCSRGFLWGARLAAGAPK